MKRTRATIASPRYLNSEVLSSVPLRDALQQARQHLHYSKEGQVKHQVEVLDTGSATQSTTASISVPASPQTVLHTSESEWQSTTTTLPTASSHQKAQESRLAADHSRKMVKDSSHSIPQPWSISHPPANDSSPSCPSECESEDGDGDGDGDSLSSYFQSFPHESSASTPTLISVDTSEPTRQSNGSDMQIDKPASTAVPVLRNIKTEYPKDTTASSTSIKKSVAKVCDPDRDWRYDLAEAYSTLQDLVHTYSKGINGVDKAEEDDVDFTWKSKLKVSRCSILNEVIVFIGDLLEENKSLKGELKEINSSPITSLNSHNIQDIKVQLPVTKKVYVTPVQHPISNKRPRRPLQCSKEDDIQVPASLPGLLNHLSTPGHVPSTTPAQIAKDLDDTVMQLCMPKGNLLPLRPKDDDEGTELSVQTINLMILDSSPDSAKSAQSVMIPSMINVPSTTTPSLPLSSLSLQQKATHSAQDNGKGHSNATQDNARATEKETDQFHRDKNDVSPTSNNLLQDSPLTNGSLVADLSVTKASSAIVTESSNYADRAWQQAQQGFPFAFPSVNGKVASTNSPALESQYAIRSSAYPTAAPVSAHQALQLYDYSGNATSPGIGCQLSVIDTPRRKSVSHDTPPDSTNSNTGNADSIVHLPTLPSLKNFRIHTSTIRGRRQQRKLNGTGSVNPATLPAENALELTVSTGTANAKVDENGNTGAAVISAPIPINQASNIIGTMDFQPSAFTRSSSYAAPKANNDKAAPWEMQPPVPSRKSVTPLSHPLMDAPVQQVETRSPTSASEDAYLLPQGAAVAQDPSPTNGNSKAIVEQVAIDQQAEHAVPTALQYQFASSVLPAYREMQIPRHQVQQQVYPAYTYAPEPTFSSHGAYMPYFPGYPYQNVHQAMPQQVYGQWYHTRPLPQNQKRKASVSVTAYNPLTDTHNQVTQQPFGYNALHLNTMKQHAYDQMARNQFGAAQSPYCLAWNTPEMPSSAPGMQQQFAMSPSPMPMQGSPQNASNNMGGMPSRQLDPIPEHEPLAKRSRLE